MTRDYLTLDCVTSVPDSNINVPEQHSLMTKDETANADTSFREKLQNKTDKVIHVYSNLKREFLYQF